MGKQAPVGKCVQSPDEGGRKVLRRVEVPKRTGGQQDQKYGLATGRVRMIQVSEKPLGELFPKAEEIEEVEPCSICQ